MPWIAATPAAQAVPLDPRRLVLFDLSAACNTTTEGFVATPFVFDYMDQAMPITNWWGNPPIGLSPGPRMLRWPSGVPLLTVGRPPMELGDPPRNVLALCSWRPQPWPAAATIPVGFPCRRIWILWQNYVHPIKNYLVNGEVVLRYADGRRLIVSLVPPYNLDCYFQHFSRQGEAIPLGHVAGTSGFAFVDGRDRMAHADVLEIPGDGGRVLASVGIRATCSEVRWAYWA